MRVVDEAGKPTGYKEIPFPEQGEYMLNLDIRAVYSSRKTLALRYALPFEIGKKEGSWR